MTKEIQTQKSQISIGAFQGSRALTFNTLGEIHKFAEMVCKTELAPKAYRGKAEDATIAIIYGMEIGLPPLASLQNIAVVNGSPTVYGDGQISLVQASGKYEYHKSYYKGTFPNDDFTAVFEVKRIGAKELVIKEYSIADAKRAGLWNKSGTWTTNPKLMLLYKPKSYALREAFADILKGMHSAEEMEGEQIIDVTPQPQSKTAALHTPPANLEAAFAPKMDIVQEVAEQNNSDSPSVNTDQELFETKEFNSDEKTFQELKEYIGAAGFKTTKAVDMFLNMTHKEKIASLQDEVLRAEILALANREKDKIKQ